MITSVQAVAAAAQQVPGYCTSGAGVLTPQQWKTCWQLGWNPPAGANVSSLPNPHAAPVAIAVILGILLLIAVLRGGSRKTVTAK